MSIRVILYSLVLLLSWNCQSGPPDHALQEEQSIISLGDNPRKHVVGMVYHRFGENRYPSTNITLTTFEAHLQYLYDQKFKVLTLGEALDYLEDPAQPYLEQVAVITVDDGYKSFLTGALPLLSKFGFKATLFINTESVGGNQYMDWEEIKQVVSLGTEIGNHSHSHAHFLDLGAKRTTTFKEDISVAQKQFQAHLGFSPDLFAYPYGEFDPALREAVEAFGFRAACAQNSGVMHSRTDRFRIPRFPMGGPFTRVEGFKEKTGMKPLRVAKQKPESFLLQHNNPPVLTVQFSEDSLRWSQLQCFVQGGECKITVNESAKTVEVRAVDPLRSRRTLYTLTCPDAKGNWRWYSHLWINTSVKE